MLFALKILGLLALFPGSFAVLTGGAVKVWKVVRARRHAAATAHERAAAPVAYHVEDRTAAVRVGGFHACEIETCVLPKPHPCHDFTCWRRKAGSCQPLHLMKGGRA